MKTILISGASSGIGKAISKRLLAQGNKVVGLSRRADKMLTEQVHYQHYAVDFSKLDTLENELKSVLKPLESIDGVICCAGYGKFTELEQFSFQQMRHIMDVNFLSQALLVKCFLPELKRQQHGKIILMGSECALEGSKKASLYSASKFALRGFAQSLRKECANSNVAVTMINPGLVDTPFYDDLDFRPDQAILPEQIADTVLMLMQLENNCVLEEINLKPMRNKIIKPLAAST